MEMNELPGSGALTLPPVGAGKYPGKGHATAGQASLARQVRRQVPGKWQLLALTGGRVGRACPRLPASLRKLEGGGGEGARVSLTGLHRPHSSHRAQHHPPTVADVFLHLPGYDMEKLSPAILSPEEAQSRTQFLSGCLLLRAEGGGHRLST